MSIITADPSRIYVHYGSKAFDKEKVKEVRNEFYLNKPRGGFWGSPVDTDWGWKDWCEGEQYGDLSSHFYFSLTPGTKILLLKDPGDERAIPTSWMTIGTGMFAERVLQSDFVALRNFGIDAVELIHGDNYSYWHDINLDADRRDYSRNSMFNSWDCDSIVIFNKDSVIDLGDEYDRRNRDATHRDRRAG